MKNIITLIFIVFISKNLLAFNMYSEVNFDLQNGLTKNLIIECSNQNNVTEQICQKTCGQMNMCVIAESICLDCASQKNHEMNILYSSKASDFFQTNQNVISGDMISYFLRHKKVMTITYDLFLNFYTPELSKEISLIFSAICRNNSEKNLMLAEIDSQTQNISSIPAVVCTGSDNNSVIYKLDYNPHYSLEKNNFWDTLQKESGYAIKRIGLKLNETRALSLP